ncbi:MAG: SGNH/GDSL hydrolase family protein [Steroidobacteraceae bacterium]
MKSPASLVLCSLLGVFSGTAPAATSLLFIGNSFTYGAGSPVKFYRSSTVTDLNNEGIGGVPALFKSFTQQAGLDYEVALETRGGSGIEFHLENKLGVIGKRPWDAVVMQGQSTLDFDKPRDPAKLVATTKQMADFLRGRNAQVNIYLMSTWARADQVYPATGAWAGKTVDAMTKDVRAAYDKAAAGTPGVKTVIPVGESWMRAVQTGLADPNPYDGIEAGKVDLWTYDHYHASTHGYYLEALVIFGSLTGRDPRSLGENECSGYELGMPTTLVKALQQVAFDQLGGTVTSSPLALAKPNSPERCSQP